ncbi:hypothetical protein J23TS9_39370 [Paenibacillus sp. J23TS9]|uniref:hypothetical protein n=1 Tax=Paenibacillus sp. J23TS9 TaxID=2807193 RepID=UPI001B00D491|nr:hypothetical protein [Paenibacillus sp. J23TS9]GIP28807.1 hypothetical protein J23TS9_39370 [Paenibacillus sp. J23TS9]
MIRILLIYIVSAVIILLLDRKVIQSLPKINRWFTYIILIAGMFIFAYSLQVKHIVYGSVWLSRWLGPFVPF